MFNRVIQFKRWRRVLENPVTYVKLASPDYARDLNPSEMWAQKKSRSSLI